MNESAVLYALSTLAQSCAALAAFVGAVGLYRLQLLASRHRDLYSDIHATQGAPSALTRQQVRNQAKTSGSRLADELLREFDALVPRLQSGRCALIVFEGWNLLVIGLSLVGFNYIPLLVSSPWTFWALWVAALGTVAVTAYCVFVWTQQ